MAKRAVQGMMPGALLMLPAVELCNKMALPPLLRPFFPPAHTLVTQCLHTENDPAKICSTFLGPNSHSQYSSVDLDVFQTGPNAEDHK